MQKFADKGRIFVQMEEEFVISSWQQSDFPKDRNGSFSNTIKGLSKENIDMNAWLPEQDSRLTRSSLLKTEEDDTMLDDDTLSRLIEGDVKSDEELESFISSRKPKPMPRHDTRLPNAESLSNKDSADKLFCGEKDSEVRLFSDTNDCADKLFSGEKDKEKHNGPVTSPRPIPRPRSRPVSKEKAHESNDQMSHFFNQTHDSKETSADKLFDSSGKSSKSVSFIEADEKKDSTGTKIHQKIEFVQENSGKERTPPRKAPRNSPRRVQTLDESDSRQNSKRTSEHKNRPQPLQRHRKEQTTGSNILSIGLSSERPWTSDGKQGDTVTQFKEKMYGDKMSEGKGKGGSNAGWESIEHDADGIGSYSRSKQEKIYSHHDDSLRKDKDTQGNITGIFEEHVPVSSESVMLGGEENRTDKHAKRSSGRGNNVRSPMKARRGLNEMTKSPDMYNFKYESRDSPQIGTFSRTTRTLSSQRSSSLTDLDSWKNTQFEDYHDEESLESSRSGFSSSRGIRDAVYSEWLEKKRGKLKEAVRRKVEEKRKEEENIKEKQEKQLLAKKAFEAWSSKKEEVIKTKIKKKKDIKETEIDAKREKIIKKQDAKKFFESWKSKKDEVLKESYKEKKVKEREAKQKKIEDHKEKIEIAKKAYDKWRSNKDEVLKEEARSARQSEKIKTKYEKEAQMEKRQECERSFQEFLRKKGTGKRAPPSPSLTQRAWCPGGITKSANLIPEKVQPVVAPPALNRSRSFTGPTRTMTFNTNKRLSRGW